MIYHNTQRQEAARQNYQPDAYVQLHHEAPRTSPTELQTLCYVQLHHEARRTSPKELQIRCLCSANARFRKDCKPYAMFATSSPHNKNTRESNPRFEDADSATFLLRPATSLRPATFCLHPSDRITRARLMFAVPRTCHELRTCRQPTKEPAENLPTACQRTCREPPRTAATLPRTSRQTSAA